METFAGIVIALVVLFFYMQFRMVRRMKRMEGTEAPRNEFTDSSAGNEPRLLYFYTPTCHACKAMTPQVENLMERYDNVQKVDLSQSMEMARQFGIMATPTTILVKEGKIEKVLVGAKREQQLEELLAG